MPKTTSLFLKGGTHKKRTKYLENLGYTVIRFENKMVFDNFQSVLQEILNKKKKVPPFRRKEVSNLLGGFESPSSSAFHEVSVKPRLCIRKGS